MFYGSSGAFAELFAAVGLLLIVVAEAPRIVAWLDRRRVFSDFMLTAVAGPTPVERVVDTTELLDAAPTEKVKVSEWLREELGRTAPAGEKSRRSSKPPRVNEWLRGDASHAEETRADADQAEVHAPGAPRDAGDRSGAES